MIFPPQIRSRSVVSRNSFNPDHSFTIRHLGLYPSAFLFAILRVIFEVKRPQCLYRRRFRVNPDAPKFPILRFIHSLSSVAQRAEDGRFPKTWDFIHRPIAADLGHSQLCLFCVIRVTAIHSKSLARSLQNLLRTVCGFTLVLEPKVFRQPFVQVLPILAGQMDGKLDLWYRKGLNLPVST